jgi:hypothetical protein
MGADLVLTHIYLPLLIAFLTLTDRGFLALFRTSRSVRANAPQVYRIRNASPFAGLSYHVTEENRTTLDGYAEAIVWAILSCAPTTDEETTISGSFAMHCYMRSLSVSPLWTSGDIDFYVSDPGNFSTVIESFMERLKSIGITLEAVVSHQIRRQRYGRQFLISDYWLPALLRHHGLNRLSFVTSAKKAHVTATANLQRFDIDACQIGMGLRPMLPSGLTIDFIATDAVKERLRTHAFRVVNRNSGTEHRVQKYLQRGFSQVPEMDWHEWEKKHAEDEVRPAFLFFQSYSHTVFPQSLTRHG